MTIGDVIEIFNSQPCWEQLTIEQRTEYLFQAITAWISYRTHVDPRANIIPNCADVGMSPLDQRIRSIQRVMMTYV